MRKILLVVVVVGLLALLFLLSGCTPEQRMGVIGGGIGALIDKDNPWRGGVIGVVAGVALHSVVQDMMKEAARKAAAENQPVVFQRVNAERQLERVKAVPIGVTADGMKVVSVKHVINGKVIKEEITVVPMK